MQRLTLTAFGAPEDVLALTEIPTPELTAEQVLVRMEAATINGSDLMLIRGMYPIRPSLPADVGCEGVGCVIKTGSAVEALRGKRVVVLPTYEQGTWAEEIVVSRKSIVEVDESADPLQLAMLPINPATAYLLLTKFRSLQAGDWIGQTAANSAVGQYVTQLARSLGVKTLNVVRRPEAAEVVRKLGGDAVLVQGDSLDNEIGATLGQEQLALALDMLGGQPIGTLMHHLRIGGAGVGYALQSGSFPAVSPLDLYFRNLSLNGFWMVNWLRSAPHEEIQETYRHLARLVAEGSLSARVEKTYKLAQYKEAIVHAQQSERSGKVLFSF